MSVRGKSSDKIKKFCWTARYRVQKLLLLISQFRVSLFYHPRDGICTRHAHPTTTASPNMEIDSAETKTISRNNTHDNGAVQVKQRTALVPREEREKREKLERIRRQREANKAYGRGKSVNVKNIKDKKLRTNLSRLENKYRDAANKAKDAEILLENTGGFLEAETELERTYKVRQDDISEGVAVSTAQKRFELKLEELGPYLGEYTRNGRELLLAGRKGHVATFDWREGKLGCEIQLGETIRDVRWLHNNQFFAAAQKKYTYIYDRNGVEIHCLRKHTEVTHMEFLPYHFLLGTVVSTADKLFFWTLLIVEGGDWLAQVPGRFHRQHRRRVSH